MVVIKWQAANLTLFTLYTREIYIHIQILNKIIISQILGKFGSTWSNTEVDLVINF